jgi:uncharacterized protein (DUF3084 family)
VSESGFIMEATLQLMVEQLRELKSAVNAGHLELKAEINTVIAGQEQLRMEISAVNAGQEELKTDINGVKTDISAVTAGQEELKTDINRVKTDISAVTAGQEELKNDMESEISAVKNDIENSISAVKGNISALETKINAGQEELRQELSAFQERIKAGQAEFEERVTCTVDTRLKNVSLWSSSRRVTYVRTSAGISRRPGKTLKHSWRPWRSERDVRVVAARGPTPARSNRLSSMEPHRGSCSIVSSALRPSITIGRPERRPLTS